MVFRSRLTDCYAIPSFDRLAATVVVAVGAGALISSVPHATTTLTLGGAGYLLWLGVGLLRDQLMAVTQGNDTQTAGWRWALKGFGVSGLNPKVFLLFLAVLPQFSDLAAAWPVSVQMAVLGLLHVLNCAVIYALVAAFARAALRSRPAVASLVGRGAGAAMIGVAIFLVVERIH